MSAHSDFTIRSGGASLRATSAGNGAPAILLHAGVADRRMWRETMAHLSATHRAITYDRHGFGETQTPDEAFRHIDDLHAIIAQAGGEPAILIGCSQGGRIAIDYALAHPHNVAALVLVATSVSGAPSPEDYPPGIAALNAQLDEAEEKGDVGRVNAIEAHLWLDGPLEQAGRVPGAARDLFLDMNSIALRHAPLTLEDACPPAMPRLASIRVPCVVIQGDLDFPHIQERSRAIAATIPGAGFVSMPGCAHLPNMEQPTAFNEALSAFLSELHA